MSPDVCDYLSRVPGEWSRRDRLSAADLSRFCLDRDDWGIFVPMWACLWGAVVKAKPYNCEDQRMRAALIALVSSDEFLQAAQEHYHRYGAAAHVLMLVRQFGPRLVAASRAPRVTLGEDSLALRTGTGAQSRALSAERAGMGAQS